MNERWDYHESMDGRRREEHEILQKKESLFRSVILFRALPVLLVIMSMSCLFFGWVRIPDNLQKDLSRIQKYVGVGNNLLNKYLGTSELAGINTEEIGELLGIFADGQLSPYEIYSEGETVQNASESVSRICAKLKLDSDTADALAALSEKIQWFRYLFFAVIGTGMLTILLILFRKKFLGNWCFSIATALMAGWCWRLAGSINEKLAEGGDLKCTLIPVIALLLSLPWIPYRKKKQ